MELEIVILAAGQGTRMRSALPKVLHPLAGKPLLQHVLDCANGLQPKTMHVVYGHGGERVPQSLAHNDVHWVEQAEQLGTGHAVQQAMPEVADESRVLVLYGDVPLIQEQTLRQLCATGSDDRLDLLTVELEDPHGYGRVVRHPEHGHVQSIVEHKDASPDQHAIREVNTGILAAPAQKLRHWLSQLRNDNAQGEFYLTDIIALAVADGTAIEAVHPQDVREVLGVNDRLQLNLLERYHQHRLAQQLMRDGVSVMDAARIDIRGELIAGRDSVIDVNTVFEGRVVLGEGVRIGPNVTITDSELGDGVEVLANSVIEQAHVGKDSRVGPFARLRPDTRLAEQVHVGNFVEIKKSHVARGSKINHLSYVGDSTVGSGVNIGAGTITCNYDGAYKHRTVIEDDAFIGSDTQLVAPVTVGKGATLGAGTTLTRDAPAGKLTLSRARQTTIDGWKRPVKNKPA